jgi:hypothetical protein
MFLFVMQAANVCSPEKITRELLNSQRESINFFRVPKENRPTLSGEALSFGAAKGNYRLARLLARSLSGAAVNCSQQFTDRSPATFAAAKVLSHFNPFDSLPLKRENTQP